MPETPGNHSGWAEDDEPTMGLFSADMLPPRGFFATDMPVGKFIPPPRPQVKGVPEATVDTDEDHQPGGGEWRPV